ncbi:MAG TPA: hypothetical protein VMM82_08800 [Spirochaetia bacterium]|nr:hypothetical protein [Spirochaetia bacterium]
MGTLNWLHSLSGAVTAGQVSMFVAIVTAIVVVIGVAAGLVRLNSLIALRVEGSKLARRQAARQLFASYLREYRTPQMGRAIANLWDLYRLSRRNPRELVRLYIRLYKKERTHAFHFEVRRRVSTFYQHLALLVQEEEGVREEVYRIWSKQSLDLIPKVLLPLETVAIPEIIGGYRSEVSQENFMIDISPQRSVKALQQLYANAPEKLGEDRP